MSRPDWPAYWLQVAQSVATRSTCPRLQVGAVLVWKKRIVATGYNGAPARTEQCDEAGCWLDLCPAHGDHCRRALHAETNLINQLMTMATLWQSDLSQIHQHTYAMVCYVTHEPCPRCREQLARYGITRFRWTHPYREKYAEGDCILTTRRV